MNRIVGRAGDRAPRRSRGAQRGRPRRPRPPLRSGRQRECGRVLGHHRSRGRLRRRRCRDRGRDRRLSRPRHAVRTYTVRADEPGPAGAGRTTSWFGVYGQDLTILPSQGRRGCRRPWRGIDGVSDVPPSEPQSCEPSAPGRGRPRGGRAPRAQARRRPPRRDHVAVGHRGRLPLRETRRSSRSWSGARPSCATAFRQRPGPADRDRQRRRVSASATWPTSASRPFPVGHRARGRLRAASTSPPDVAGRDFGAVMGDVSTPVRGVQFPLEYRAEVLGTARERSGGPRSPPRPAGRGERSVSSCSCRRRFGSWRLAFVVCRRPARGPGRRRARGAPAPGGLTIGALAGSVAVLTIAARNAIVLIARYQQLERASTARPRR